MQTYLVTVLLFWGVICVASDYYKVVFIADTQTMTLTQEQRKTSVNRSDTDEEEGAKKSESFRFRCAHLELVHAFRSRVF